MLTILIFCILTFEFSPTLIPLSRLFLDKKPVWLLDEPYVFLDEQNTIDLNKQISRFKLEGGLVIITSNIDIDFPFSERVIL